MQGPDGNDFTSTLCPSYDGTLTLTATESDYTSDSLPVGTYTFSITGTATGGDSDVATFTWTLIDPCNPTDSIAVADPAQANFEYYVGDGALTITRGVVTISPSFCEFTKQINVVTGSMDII